MRIKLWITLGEDGRAAVSSEKPTIEQIKTTDRMGLYPVPGEFWWHFMCKEAVIRILGYLPPVNTPVQTMWEGRPWPPGD